jgi:23S rRNA (uracil1939-C5)-methyltransferase
MDPKIKLSIDNLGCYGEGVGKLDGFTIFVEGALPGEEVTAQLFKREKRYGKARLLTINSPSLSRVTPACSLFERCGGCQIMHLDYEEQLRIKRQKVVDALMRIGKLDVEVLPCIASPEKLSYRNKIQVPVQNGKIGFYARSSNDLIDVEHCHIHCPLGQQVYEAARKILQGRSLKALIIKSALSTKEVLIVLVTMEGCEEVAKELIQIPHVKGVVQNFNDREDNVVLGKDFKVLAGESFITEIICCLRFKV